MHPVSFGRVIYKHLLSGTSIIIYHNSNHLNFNLLNRKIKSLQMFSEQESICRIQFLTSDAFRCSIKLQILQNLVFNKSCIFHKSLKLKINLMDHFSLHTVDNDPGDMKSTENELSTFYVRVRAKDANFFCCATSKKLN